MIRASSLMRHSLLAHDNRRLRALIPGFLSVAVLMVSVVSCYPISMMTNVVLFICALFCINNFIVFLITLQENGTDEELAASLLFGSVLACMVFAKILYRILKLILIDLLLNGVKGFLSLSQRILKS